MNKKILYVGLLWGLALILSAAWHPLFQNDLTINQFNENNEQFVSRTILSYGLPLIWLVTVGVTLYTFREEIKNLFK